MRGAGPDFMRTSANVAIPDLIKIAMRSFPDRIIIGEARRGKEMIEILTAWGTGQRVDWQRSTRIPPTPEAALQRVEDMLLQVAAAPCTNDRPHRQHDHLHRPHRGHPPRHADRVRARA